MDNSEPLSEPTQQSQSEVNPGYHKLLFHPAMTEASSNVEDIMLDSNRPG